MFKYDNFSNSDFVDFLWVVLTIHNDSTCTLYY